MTTHAPIIEIPGLRIHFRAIHRQYRQDSRAKTKMKAVQRVLMHGFVLHFESANVIRAEIPWEFKFVMPVLPVYCPKIEISILDYGFSILEYVCVIINPNSDNAIPWTLKPNPEP